MGARRASYGERGALVGIRDEPLRARREAVVLPFVPLRIPYVWSVVSTGALGASYGASVGSRGAIGERRGAIGRPRGARRGTYAPPGVPYASPRMSYACCVSFEWRVRKTRRRWRRSERHLRWAERPPRPTESLARRSLCASRGNERPSSGSESIGRCTERLGRRCRGRSGCGTASRTSIIDSEWEKSARLTVTSGCSGSFEAYQSGTNDVPPLGGWDPIMASSLRPTAAEARR